MWLLRAQRAVMICQLVQRYNAKVDGHALQNCVSCVDAPLGPLTQRCPLKSAYTDTGPSQHGRGGRRCPTAGRTNRRLTRNRCPKLLQFAHPLHGPTLA